MDATICHLNKIFIFINKNEIINFIIEKILTENIKIKELSNFLQFIKFFDNQKRSI